MSDNNFLKIANVCSIPFTSQLVQPNNSKASVAVPIGGPSTCTVADPNLVGMYVVPTGTDTPTTATTTFIQVPADQIHQVVQQVVERQPGQQIPLAGNVQTSYVIQSPANISSSLTTSGGLQLLSTQPQIVQQSKMSHSVGVTETGAQMRTVLKKFITDKETVLQNNDALNSKFNGTGSQFVVNPSVQIKPDVHKYSPSTTVQKQNPEVVNRLSSPAKNATTPQSAIFKSKILPTQKDKLLKKEIKSGQIVLLSRTIVRPQTPTRMCVLQKSDESLFSSSLVQIKVKNDSRKGQVEQTRDVICGISCKAKVKVSKYSTLPLDSDLFWCNFCPYTCENKVEFLHHVMTHRFNCLHCKFQAFSRAEVIQHSAKTHPAFPAELFSFCSLFSDHLKLAVRGPASIQESPLKSSTDYLREELTENNYELLDLVLEGDQLSENEELNADTSMSPFKSETSKPTSVAKMTTSAPKKESELIDDPRKSWNCKYCDFVSQDYQLINVHCTIMHPTKPMSAREVKVSNDLALQIHQLDTIRQLHLDKGEKEFLKSTKQSGGAELWRKDEDVQELKDSRESCIQIFECCNCHGQTLKIKELSNHLKTEHTGEMHVALDLKAVRSRQARNIAFCPKKGCYFYSRTHVNYEEHINCCCTNWSNLDKDVCKSIALTLQYAKRNMKTHSRTKAVINNISCVYCQYETKLPYHLKKHVVSDHPNEKPVYRLAKSSEKGLRSVRIFFCPECIRYQTGKFLLLKQHLFNVHRSRIPLAKPDTKGLLGASNIISNGSIEIDIATTNDGPDIEASMDILEHEDIKPNAEELNSMMENYLEGETQAKIAAGGHLSRHAAIKADLRLKSPTPRRYKCKQCKYQCLGVNLMRTHIWNDHVSLPLVAIDVKKREGRQRSLVYICPELGCPYCHGVGDRLRQHCKDEHDMTDIDLPCPVDKLTVKRVTHPNYPPMFECLYCVESFVTNTPALMKDHLKQSHPGEIIIMRDLVARKLGAACRLYMCDLSTCEYTTSTKTEYLIHVRQHTGYEEAHKEMFEEEDHGDDPDVNDDVDDGDHDGDNFDNNDDHINTEEVTPVPMEQGTTEQETIDIADNDDENVDEIMVQDTTTKDVVMIKLDI